MKKILQSLFILVLLGICLTPFSQVNQLSYTSNSQSLSPTDSRLSPAGDWGSMVDPNPLNVDTYYTLPTNYDLCYATFHANAGDIYYMYLASLMFWDAELYNDSAYSVLLGTFYSVSSQLPASPFAKYLIFSPAHSGWYYLILYSHGFNGKLAILNATSYHVNSTQLVVISSETCPVKFFDVNLIQGNYSTNRDTLYVKVDRRWNYVILPDLYGALGSGSIYLENGSYGIMIEDSCNFCLTGYLYFPRNETIPDDPDDNKTDTRQPSSIFDGITPLFGIGVLVGLCALYKFKKK